MVRGYFSKMFALLARIGARPDDSEEVRLRKSLLVISTIPFVFVGALWGCLYFSFGEQQAGIIPVSYSLFSIASLIHFGFTGQFRVFRFNQLFLILLLPFALMLALGGFINSSAVILWSIICPLGAMLFDEQSKSTAWLWAFIFLVFLSVFLQFVFPMDSSLTPLQIQLFFVLNIVSVGTLIFMMFYYFVEKKNYFQARSEALLLNILPWSIAEELKTKGRTEATHFENVTVLFTDFKDFTSIAEKLPASQLVAEIDYCFKAFDSIVGRYPIEKIKTIGDSYMCAGGVPVVNSTHAKDMMRVALEMRQFMNEYALARTKEGRIFFEIRIGVHTGPVVAGIVGDKKFAYDIWGDTVNIASRMESSGEAGKINISGTTYALVKDEFHGFHRGKIHAKNKGEIEMYFLESVSVKG